MTARLTGLGRPLGREDSERSTRARPSTRLPRTPRTGDRLAAGRDGTVRRIDLNTGAITASRATQGRARPCPPEPGRRVSFATSGEDGTIRTWDVQSGRRINRYDVPDKWVRSLYFSADGRSIYTAISTAGVDRVGVAENGKFEEAEHLYKHDDVVYETVLFPRGDFLV